MMKAAFGVTFFFMICVSSSADGISIPTEWRERYENTDDWAVTKPSGDLLQPSVRLIYFLPSDREVQPERAAALCQMVTDVQEFYADEMQRHGFGRKTFTLETDAGGIPVVHFIRGKFKDDYYQKPSEQNTSDELFEHVNDRRHVYLIVVDSSYGLLLEGRACGLGGVTFIPAGGEADSVAGTHRDKTTGESGLGGVAIMPASGHCFFDDVHDYLHPLRVAVHELAHAFGLMHDYRADDSAVGGTGHQFSQCDAEWLSVSRFLNNEITPNDSPGSIELLAAPKHTPDKISISFRVEDADGLHQAQLLVPDHLGGREQDEFFGCKQLNSTTNTIEFIDPASTRENVDRITLQIIDKRGAITRATFLIDLDALTPANNALDVNGDGVVNISDLIPIGSRYGQRGQDSADVNGDGFVDIIDVLLVAGFISSLPQQVVEMFAAADVRKWLTDAKQRELQNEILRKGHAMLEYLLAEIDLLNQPIEVISGKLKATLQGHTDHVWSVAFSPDGQTLASAGFDNTIRVWNPHTGQHKFLLVGHTSEVVTVAFSPDGNTLASAGWDGAIRLWNPHSGKLKEILSSDRGAFASVAFSPDGSTLVSGGGPADVLLWDTTTWEIKRSLTGHAALVDAVAISPNGRILASGSRDKTVRLWDIHTGQLNHILTGHASDVNRLAFSPDGSTLASAGLDSVSDSVRLWNTQTGAEKERLTPHTNWLRPVAFSPDGSTLAIGGSVISLWDTQTGQYLKPIHAAADVVSIAFSPDGQIVASGHTGGQVNLSEFSAIASGAPFADVPLDVTNIPEPVPPPPAVREFFELDSFYQQWINVEGFPVLASEKVNPYAVKETAWQIKQMVGDRSDILKAMADLQVRFILIAHDEMASEIPELRAHWDPYFFTNVRLRGGACWYYCRAIVGSEEQVFINTAVTIHEMAHGIHEAALNNIDPTFDKRLKTAYNAAMEKGLWKGYYAATNHSEYWAVGVTIWFGDSYINPVETRDALKTYDPNLALLIAEVFGDHDWRYTQPTTRTHLPHLQGFDPQSAPSSVEWPPGVLEAYEELRNPAVEERSEWVNVPPYAPSMLPRLIESRNKNPEDDSSGGWTYLFAVNTSDAEVLFYWVHADGTETLLYRNAPIPWMINHFRCRPGDLLLAKDATGKNLAVFQAVEKFGRVFVGPTLHFITAGLSKVSGDNQEGVSGTVLANPFVIQVKDDTLSVLEGISVTFAVAAGDGTLSVASTTTDENGRAESTLTLGQHAGTNTVEVAVTGIQEIQTFTAEGVRTSQRIHIVSGNEQQGLPGEVLARPFVVEIQDQNGVAFEGVLVTFTVTNGGGTLSATSATTDSNGRAKSVLTLGPDPGTNTVEVAVAGIQERQTTKAIGELPPIPEDVNGDGVVNILDLVRVASVIGAEGTDLESDVNGDGVVNILDLVLVAGALENAAAAPPANP